MTTKEQRAKRKAEIIEQIRQHLMLEGPVNLDPLMATFPDISRPTFFRYLKEAKELIESDASADGPGVLRMAQKRIRTRAMPAEARGKDIRATLPVAPSPAVIAADPHGAMQAFDFMKYFHKILADAELVRNSAVVKNADGTEKLRNPVVMDRSVARRLSIIETYLHSMETVYNLEKIQELYRIVINAVGKADPDTQQAILAELRRANNAHGLTMAAHL